MKCEVQHQKCHELVINYHSSEMTEIRIENDPNLANLLRIPINVTKLVLENCQNLRDINALSRLF